MSAVSRWQEQNIQLEFRLAGLRLTRATFVACSPNMDWVWPSIQPFRILLGFDVAVILAYPSSNLLVCLRLGPRLSWLG